MLIRRTTLVMLAAIFVSAGCIFAFHRAARAHTRLATSIAARSAQSSSSAQQSGQDSGAKPTTLSFVEDPEVVPPISAHDLSGGVVSTAALKGKVVIVNFWATWCGPCREEIPEMIRLQAQYKDTLQVVGVSEDDDVSPADVAKFAKKAGINYPVIMVTDAIEQEFGGIAALPTSFLVNKDGRVVQKDVGVYPLEYYSLQVRALMGLPVDARIETFKDTGQVFLKNASRASELPGVSFAGLTPAQKKIALRRLNATACTCGCKLTLAECRINDTSCPISGAMAMKIVHQIAHASSAATPKSGASR